MEYAIENALFQWEEGARRLRDAEEPERRLLERARDEVLEELRRRLGSTFTVPELADLYAGDTGWAWRIAQDRAPGGQAAAVVDAAFGRYAREASDYSGGRVRRPA
jgi:hypothetical protein